jgi:signal transduction histidine kinase
LAQIGALSAGIAHEIRNPLSSILGAVELLRRSRPEDPGGYLGVIAEEVRRLDATLNSLLEYASARPGRARCEWDEAWRRVERLVAGDLPAGVTLEHSPAGPLTRAVTGAPLQQILNNLVHNATRAAGAPAAGARGDLPLTPPRIAVSAWARGRWAIIEVSDNGPGIPPDLMPRLFTPFATGSPGGTGLGLAMVRRLAQLYGGTAWAENLSPGARFVIELPLADDPARAADEPARPKC